MARSITIGNGNLLVGLDARGQVRDLYYPFVGQANHVSGASGNFVHRVGVFVDGALSWFDDAGWSFDFGTTSDTMTGSFVATHSGIGVTIRAQDAVHNENNIFLRYFTVENNSTTERTIKVFFSQQFRIAESRRGDTAFYDPRVRAIVHYKGHSTFLINASIYGKQFTEYNIGLFGIEGKEGTYFDAADGVLEGNSIEHGSVDSVIAVTAVIPPSGSAPVAYWITCASSVAEVHTLDAHVIAEQPHRLIASTEAYWQAWVEKDGRDLSPLPAAMQTLYRRSLMVMRVHTDNRGGIIASSDTDMLHHGRDTYAYVWPRDAALIAHAFDVTGYGDVAKRFYSFAARVLEPGGYLMHKYRSDGVLGSSWHPWMHNGQPRLPIQEDETATVVVMLWHHYEKERDLEFIESLYNTFIEPAAQFMCEFIEPTTGLPHPSYDLWEEKFGISTYTASSVYAALMVCARFAMILGKDTDARTYQAIAERMQGAIASVLYNPELKMFVKHVNIDGDGERVYDTTLDTSSFYGPLFFGVFDEDNAMIKASLKTVEEKLQVGAQSKGFVRYEGDGYYRMHDAESPNPWIVTTLWIAQYYLRRATKLTDLKRPLELLEWTVSHAAYSGMLAEQMHPNTRAHLSTAPLIWSHAEYVLTVNAYLEKYRSFQS
jgi:GH15 family glucan-1,4-alpha-glucosidase